VNERITQNIAISTGAEQFIVLQSGETLHCAMLVLQRSIAVSFRCVRALESGFQPFVYLITPNPALAGWAVMIRALGAWISGYT
jgi:hypothetical protein